MKESFWKRSLRWLISQPESAGNQGVILMISFFLASFLWLLVQLNDPYETQVPVAVKIEEIPPEIQLSPNVFPQVMVTVEGLGGDLLSYLIKLQRDTVRIPYNKEVEAGYLITRNHLSAFRQPFSTVRMTGMVTPDSLRISSDRKVRKKVPLRSQVEIQMAPHYLLERNPELSPDSVTLIGPQPMLDTIQEWYTKALRSDRISTPETMQVGLVDTLEGLVLQPQTARLTVYPRRYTQAELTFPLSVVDVPEGKTVRLLHKTLEVTCLVPLDEYESLIERPHQMELSYLLLNPDVPFIIPDLSFLPSHVKVLTQTPSRIPYVIVNHE